MTKMTLTYFYACDDVNVQGSFSRRYVNMISQGFSSQRNRYIYCCHDYVVIIIKWCCYMLYTYILMLLHKAVIHCLYLENSLSIYSYKRASYAIKVSVAGS